jgi:hypothetical protein
LVRVYGSQLTPCLFPLAPCPTPRPTHQVDSDEEARQAEEEEVLALQAAQAAGLQDDDFGLHAFAPEPADDTQLQQQQGAAGGRATAAAAAEVETVAVDMEGLTPGGLGWGFVGWTMAPAYRAPVLAAWQLFVQQQVVHCSEGCSSAHAPSCMPSCPCAAPYLPLFHTNRATDAGCDV